MSSTAFRMLPVVVAALAAVSGPAQASSHREAPFITTSPKVDASDFYMFTSYETGRSNFVTLIANYQPLQDAEGGPNFFAMDPNALYEIHLDNNGDAKEDLTFQFRFKNTLANITLPSGEQSVAIPLVQGAPIAAVNDPGLNLAESYSVNLVRGDRRSGAVSAITNAVGGSTTFAKPADNIGLKTIPDYPAYAAKHLYTVNIPGCAVPARMFVGQRKEAFAAQLGVIFDLANAPFATITNPANINASPNSLALKNVTTLALEVDKSCLVAGTEPVIGGWTTASLRQTRVLDPSPKAGHQTSEKPGGAWTQVSRLGMPLVNEVVIGLKDKDRFNAAKPMGDGQFLTYVSNPTLPKLFEVAFAMPGIAPTNYPRNDLVTTFLTGIPGVNQPAGVVASEMLRLNTAIPPVPYAQQNRLGIVGNILAGGTDTAGYPNGRRPKDDVVDISLVAMMGGLCVANGTTNALGFGTACTPAAVPLGSAVFGLNDTVDQAAVPLSTSFPYLTTPLGGTR